MNVNDFSTGELNELMCLNQNVSDAKESISKALESLNKLEDIYPHLKDYIFEGLRLTTNLNGFRITLSEVSSGLSDIENCTDPY